MAALNYDTMSKTQKLAAFFIIIGPELAPELMKQLRDGEIEVVSNKSSGNVYRRNVFVESCSRCGTAETAWSTRTSSSSAVSRGAACGSSTAAIA